MRAALLLGVGGPEMLEVRDDVPVPTVAPGDVLVRLSGFRRSFRRGVGNVRVLVVHRGAHAATGRVGRTGVMCHGTATLGSMAGEKVHLSIGKPKVVLPAPDPGMAARIEAARTVEDLAGVVAADPESMDGWAALGERQEAEAGSLLGAVQAYASFRIGYHRGLDALRRNGWSGTQPVRWADEPNRGFLRCLAGLHRMAGRIGETDEEARCADFLLQLDPDWPPAGT